MSLLYVIFLQHPFNITSQHIFTDRFLPCLHMFSFYLECSLYTHMLYIIYHLLFLLNMHTTPTVFSFYQLTVLISDLPASFSFYLPYCLFTHLVLYLPTVFSIYPPCSLFTHRVLYLPTVISIYPLCSLFTHRVHYLPTVFYIYPPRSLFTHPVH